MAHIQIRISEEEKKKAQQIFSSMGLNLSSALKLFIRKTIQEKKIPFEISGKNYASIVFEEKESEFLEKKEIKNEENIHISERKKSSLVPEQKYEGVGGFIRKKIGL